MPPRRPKKRRSTATRAKRKAAPRGKPGKKKRTASKRAQAAASAKRSAAAKRGWAKRKKKDQLLEFLRGWREVALPNKFELYDMMEWGAQQFGDTIANMYRWYYGSEGYEDPSDSEAAE